MHTYIKFQSELDTLAATLKQLENQKGEAQKRLNDLKAQVNIIILFKSNNSFAMRWWLELSNSFIFFFFNFPGVTLINEV